MSRSEYRLIDCPYCHARATGEVCGNAYQEDSESERSRFLLLRCPTCGNLLVAREEFLQRGELEEPDVWSDAERIWPLPAFDVAGCVPELIRNSLEEADRCLRAGAFTASVVMTGRALEALCRHYQTKSQNLGQGLKELLDKEIIDKRLFEWGEALRVHRNLAAHATGEKFSHDEVRDLFQFAVAICDYVFVLTEKFQQFMKRKQQKTTGVAQP